MRVAESKGMDAARLDAAADWLQRLRTPPQNEELLAEWLQWCADPANLEAFERIQDVWQAIEAPELRPAWERSRHSRAMPRTYRLPRWRWFVGVTAVLVLCGSLGVLWLLHGTGETATQSFVTARAEDKTELLPDGSRIDLGARSRVDVRYTESRREVTFTSGEAFFTVAKKPDRPFVVTAGSVRVTAVGTAFDVRCSQDDTVVTVSEGKVSIEAEGTTSKGSGTGPASTVVQVPAGQQVRYSIGGHTLTVTQVDPDLATSWREGVLKFVDEPLGSVVAHVNRYSARQIVVDPQLARRSYTGTVQREHIDEWLRGLEHVYPLHAISEGVNAVKLVPATSNQRTDASA